MTNSRARSDRRIIAAGFVLAVSVSLTGTSLFAQDASLLQAPAGMKPASPVPQSLADPATPPAQSAAAAEAESVEREGPRRIVPPGFGATHPEAAMQSEPQPAGPAQFFPAGTQSREPSVRLLSAVPGQSNSGIEVGALTGVSAATTALISREQGGFGPDMWQGASRTDIDTYLGRLPVPSRSPVMNDLARRLLLTGAQPPVGAGGGVSLLATRIDRLIASGRTEEAIRLASAVGNERPPAIAAGLARAALAQRDDKLACDALKDIPPGADPAHDEMAAFSVKLSTYCQIAAGNPEIASLTLDLAREEGMDDALFYSLAGEAAAGIVLRAPEPKRLTIMDVAFYKLAKRELPANAVEIADPALLLPLLEDEAISSETKVLAAERAAAYGLIGGRDLAAFYRKPSFTPEQLAGLLTSDIPEASPLRRAMIFQSIGLAVAADERIQLFRLAFATAETAGLYYPTVEALYPDLERLEPSEALRPLAPAAMRAFLAIGERGHAQAWASVMAEGGQVIGRDQRELEGLSRVMSGSPAGFDKVGVSASIVADLRSGVSKTQLFAASEAMMLEALDFELDPAVWEALLDTRGALAGTVPPEALLRQLHAAGQKGAVGETVLLAIDIIGQEGPGAVHPRAAAQAVASLKAAGLESEARRVALEALMARSSAGRG